MRVVRNASTGDVRHRVDLFAESINGSCGPWMRRQFLLPRAMPGLFHFPVSIPSSYKYQSTMYMAAELFLSSFILYYILLCNAVSPSFHDLL